jgi:hypothetical protein
MNVISTTVEYKGMPVKVENGKIFLRAFGTTIYNHSMHWSWMEVKASDLKAETKTTIKRKRIDMIFWNFNTPITLIACLVWNISEYFKMPLGKLAPTVFSLALGRNGK